jgi:hypothetical protein
MLVRRIPTNPAPNPLMIEVPDRLISKVKLKTKSPKYSGGPNFKAYFAIPGPMKESAITLSVPAMKEPQLRSIMPLTTLLCHGNPSQQVATEKLLLQEY